MFRRRDNEHKAHTHRWFGVFIFFVVLVGAVLLWGPTIYVNLATRSNRYELSHVKVSEVPKRDVAIVLGAALRNGGTEPSSYLRWRVETAVKLYKAGRVDSLLMSGDGSYTNHDEPAVMRSEAIALGVPADKIQMDKFGFDTYDSCTRAKKYRSITSATVVTQGYHLPRAVFSCRAIGIAAIGVNAESQPQEGWSAYAIAREWLSTDKMFLQIARHRVRASL